MRAKTILGLLTLLAVCGGMFVGGNAFIQRVLKPAQQKASRPVPDGRVHSQVAQIYTGPSPTTTKSHRPPTPSASALSQAKSRLASLTPGMQRCVVATPNSYQAAVYNQKGHIEFWSTVAGRWQLSAQRSYPPDDQAGIPTYAEAGVTVRCQLLRGMTNATFVVDGPFSQDGSGNAVVFDNGAVGWGAVVPTAGGALESVGGSLTGPGPGLYYRVEFNHGQLETLQEPKVFGATFDDAYPVERTWAWSVQRFVPQSANIVTAQATKVTPTSVPALPSGALPSSGTYAAQVVAATDQGSTIFPHLKIQLRAGALFPCGATGQMCFSPNGVFQTVEVASTTQAVFVGTGAAGLAYATGPAWALTVPYGMCCTLGYGSSVPAGLTEYGADTWYVPPTAGLSRFLDGPSPVVELTFAGGVVTRVTEPYVPGA